ncbi:phosphatase PAP2 family protein [Intrasporangium sp. YIM S08009]|uniref:phosphatase PAP2 family protein n=1 Tax=Intrasporangium zincisolvens TaxID=3080018 RepID=UPI002B06068D|nr:phosphatase PAP2 family protein [Intrasporangium sp. YIM S08009]
MSRRTRVVWLLCGVASAIGLVVVALLVLRTSPGDAVDRWLSRVVLDGLPAILRRGLDALARPMLLVALAPVDVALALLAVVRRGWRRVGVAVLVVAVSAGVTTTIDAPALLGLPGEGYPSDHATLGFALVVALGVLWPRPLGRLGLGVGAALAVVVGVGNVSWYAHRPVDVLGSALLVASATALSVALLGGDAANVRVGDRASSQIRSDACRETRSEARSEAD